MNTQRACPQARVNYSKVTIRVITINFQGYLLVYNCRKIRLKYLAFILMYLLVAGVTN